ncbi:fasciclin domain-containing protein [Ruegeria sp. R14_0]|uniref:fasciclin domain-containing protein n=1 Tax=Ruegeria sp. R14_0 TaxID=2821100 RepID=UPI001ADA9E8F|nr:fasciclin domain-containing protein [Ruegeria sp. R14_0]MBO9446169.1 fasciclin domain-containing protein [Ruegeria sp. R14_0]
MQVPTETITGTVLLSGAIGSFDTKNSDFDILREAVIAAKLDGVLDKPEAGLTVFAPTDAAFIGLAQELGYTGSDEEGALGHIVKALTLLGGGDPIPLLTEILKYHVVEGEFDLAAVAGFGNGAQIGTLQGSSVELNLDTTPPSLGDADDGIVDPNIILTDVGATNGIIHVLDGVLLPISVTDILNQKNTDFILGDDSDEFYFTGRGQDFVHGGGGRDVINTGKGNDVALGGAGDDVLFGGRGKDTLRGDEGDDTIFGGRGSDVIDGGADDDILFGGRGKDSFVFENGDGDDLILDFQVGKDKIDLSDYKGIAGFEDIQDDISGGFFRTTIDLGDGDSIVLAGVWPGQLTEDSFMFA